MNIKGNIFSIANTQQIRHSIAAAVVIQPCPVSCNTLLKPTAINEHHFVASLRPVSLKEERAILHPSTHFQDFQEKTDLTFQE